MQINLKSDCTLDIKLDEAEKQVFKKAIVSFNQQRDQAESWYENPNTLEEEKLSFEQTFKNLKRSISFLGWFLESIGVDWEAWIKNQ